MISKIGFSSISAVPPGRGAISKKWKDIIIGLVLLNVLTIAILLASFRELDNLFNSSEFNPAVLFVPYALLALGGLMFLTPILNTVIMLIFLVKQRPKGLWLILSIALLVASVGFLVYSDISSNKDSARVQQNICREQAQRGHIGAHCQKLSPSI